VWVAGLALKLDGVGGRAGWWLGLDCC
jgi:hypothetical protein